MCAPPRGGGRRAAHWPTPRTFALLIAVIGMLGVELSRGQSPTVKARDPAKGGPADCQVTEPAIAAGPDNVLTVYHDRTTGSIKGWYALYNLWTHKWTEAEIDPNVTHGIVDVSIARDSVTGGYMAAGLGGVTKIVTCRFVKPTAPPNPPKGVVVPLGWVEVAAGNLVDKPWIVAGKPDRLNGQEYYIVYWSVGHYEYLHSLDGGSSWAGGPVEVGEDEVVGGWCAQPAVHEDGPLYVAYIHNDVIYFLVGEDQPSGLVTFSELLTTGAVRLSVPLNRTLFDHGCQGPRCLPRGYRAASVPQLAVDPNNADRLFIAYHDTVSDDPNHPGFRDVDVYVRAIVRNETIWELGDPVKVSNHDTQYESDQFMPSIIVDAAGYVHLSFYDDWRFTDGPEGDLQPDSNNTPKFDAYYAWAPVDNLNFQQPAGRNLLLYWEDPEDPDEPAAFDCTIQGILPREYNGIAWYGDRIWTAYTGSWADDEDNKTVIWTSRIDW